MQAFNVYNNHVSQGCILSGKNSCNRQALEDVRWGPMIQERFLMAGDVNAHSPICNFHYYRRQNVAVLEDLIKHFRLLVNNKPTHVT